MYRPFFCYKLDFCIHLGHNLKLRTNWWITKLSVNFSMYLSHIHFICFSRTFTKIHKNFIDFPFANERFSILKGLLLWHRLLVVNRLSFLWLTAPIASPTSIYWNILCFNLFYMEGFHNGWYSSLNFIWSSKPESP